MDKTTVSAKTYDEAITKACIELQTTSEHLHVDIIEKGSSGLFGVLGGKPCIITARILSEEEEETIRKAEEAKALEEAKKNEELKKAEEAEKAEKARAAENAGKAAEAEKAAETKSRETGKTAEPVKTETERKPRNPRRDNGPAPVKSSETAHTDEKPKKEFTEEEAAEFCQKAETFLKQLFTSMETEVTIQTAFDHDDNELSAMLTGDDMGVLIGKRGQTLDSLQYLTSLVVNKHHDGYIRVKLDTENYRERREEKLKSLAKNIAFKVKRTRKPVSLEPMNPYERRIIHSALQDDPYCTTYSEGEDPYRHIVVVLKKDAKRYNRQA